MVEGLYTQLGGEQDSGAFCWVLLIRILLNGISLEVWIFTLGQSSILSLPDFHVFPFTCFTSSGNFAKQGLLLFCMEKRARKNKEKQQFFRCFNQDTPPNSMSSMVLSHGFSGVNASPKKSQSKPMISNNNKRRCASE